MKKRLVFLFAFSILLVKDILPQSISLGPSVIVLGEVKETTKYSDWYSSGSSAEVNHGKIFSIGGEADIKFFKELPIEVGLNFLYGKKNLWDEIRGIGFKRDLILYELSVPVYYNISITNLFGISPAISFIYSKNAIDNVYTEYDSNGSIVKEDQIKFNTHNFDIAPILKADFNLYDFRLSIIGVYSFSKYTHSRENSNIEYYKYDLTGLRLGMNISYQLL